MIRAPLDCGRCLPCGLCVFSPPSFRSLPTRIQTGLPWAPQPATKTFRCVWMAPSLQDVLFVHPLSIPTQPQSMMYMVCDGHSGVEAANFVASNFLRILNTKLPSKLPNFNAPRG